MCEILSTFIDLMSFRVLKLISPDKCLYDATEEVGWWIMTQKWDKVKQNIISEAVSCIKHQICKILFKERTVLYSVEIVSNSPLSPL